MITMYSTATVTSAGSCGRTRRQKIAGGSGRSLRGYRKARMIGVTRQTRASDGGFQGAMERGTEPIGKLRTGGAMAGIERKVELFTLAYKLAWKHISEDQKRKQPNIAQRLHDSIRRQLKEGATEAVFIASEALK